jgi:hypothetical protein
MAAKPTNPSKKPVSLPPRTVKTFKATQSAQKNKVKTTDTADRTAAQTALREKNKTKTGSARVPEKPASTTGRRKNVAPEPLNKVVKRVKSKVIPTTPLDTVVKKIAKRTATKPPKNGRPSNEVTVTEGTPGRPANKKGK